MPPVAGAAAPIRSERSRIVNPAVPNAESRSSRSLQEIIGRPTLSHFACRWPLCAGNPRDRRRRAAVVPSGTLVTVDDAVTIGADLVEALAEQAVAIVPRYRRGMIVTGLLSLETGAAARRSGCCRRARQRFGLAAPR